MTYIALNIKWLLILFDFFCVSVTNRLLPTKISLLHFNCILCNKNGRTYFWAEQKFYPEWNNQFLKSPFVHSPRTPPINLDHNGIRPRPLNIKCDPPPTRMQVDQTCFNRRACLINIISSKKYPFWISCQKTRDLVCLPLPIFSQSPTNK